MNTPREQPLTLPRILMSRCLSIVALLLALAVPVVSRAEMTEAEFIAKAGAEQPAPGNEAPKSDRPHEPAKGIEEPKAKDDEVPEDEAPAGSGDDDAADDEEKEGKEGEEPEGEDDAGKSGSPAGGEEDDEDEEPTPAEQKVLDQEFQKALEAEGASPSLEDIPEEARPIVAKKIRDLEAGFTRAMQHVRADQKAALEFKAEERFRKDKPVDFIVSMLLETPEIAEGVNKRLDELDGNTTATEGHKALVDKARRDAVVAEEGEIAKVQQDDARTEQIIKLGRAAARAAGVPFDMGVEEGIAARVLQYGDITEAEIRQIANAKAAVYNRTLRQNRRDKSGQYAKDKAEDRRKAGLRIKPGQGSAPAPAAKRMPKNDDEFIREFVARGG